jgi:hypothetical protein
MRALAYLLGARALDAAHDADRGIKWPRSEPPLEPLATTEAAAGAWRRWRDRGDAAAFEESHRPRVLTPKRA